MGLVLVWALGGLLAATAQADTFKLTDGATLEGEIVSATEQGVVLRLADGGYSSRVGWDKLSQEDLKRLAKSPKYARFAEGLVLDEEPAAKKQQAKPPVVIRSVENRLERPARPSLLGGLFGSGLGLLVLLVLYAANIWAAYEVAVFRAQPVALVCALAAVVPMIPQIVFLAMPTKMPATEAAPWETGADTGAAAEPEPKIGAGLKLAQAPESAEEARKPAEPTVFKRGDFMFNRRFFETRFSNFFTLVRRDKDKGVMLVIKTSRASYTANRITRITANEMHLEVSRGAATEEVTVPFVEIQEVQLVSGGAR